MPIDPFGEEPEIQQQKQAKAREHKTDLAAERVWRKKTQEERKRAGLPPKKLPVVIKKKTTKKKEELKPLSLGQRTAQTFQRLGERNTQEQFMQRQLCYAQFQAHPVLYVTQLLGHRKLSNLCYQIPKNWQEVFAPLLQDFHIRSSYITKAVGMCSIRALFDQVDQFVKKVHPEKKGYFNVEEFNKKGMSEGRRAHKDFESRIYQLSREYADQGKNVSYRWKGFVSDDVDFTLVQEQKLEAHIPLDGLVVHFTGTGDMFFGKGKDRTVHTTEAKTHVQRYSFQYLEGCIKQGLGYIALIEHKIKELNPGDQREYMLHVVESLGPYTQDEMDAYVIKDDSKQFINLVKENMNSEDPFDRKARVLLEWNDATKYMFYRTLKELMLHRLNPRLFTGASELKQCHQFGGCKYIKAGCSEYQKLKKESESS